MTLYSILNMMFVIGAFGVHKASRKVADSSEKRKQWIKFLTYLVLVFGQVFLISKSAYAWFVVVVIFGGFYELINIRKSIKTFVVALFLYGIFAFGYWTFFSLTAIEWQQFLFVIVITFDGYSQISGQLFGRTKVFPKTSPNKTLEGMVGGCASVIVTSIILSQMLQIELRQALVSGLLIGLFSIAGDFLASFYKRQSGVKDFGKTIPGHGGILDRFDSLIVAASALYLMRLTPWSDAESWNCIAYILVFLLLFFVAEIGYRTFKVKAEITRKFVHIFSGLTCLTFPFFLDSWISVLGLCFSFIFLLIVSKKYNLLPSINAIDRKSSGSILFPVSIFGCFLLFYKNQDYLEFYLPVLILAICDPLAALAGKRWSYGKYKIGNDFKTIVGSAAFLASCFAVLMLSVCFPDGNFSIDAITKCVAIAIVATLVEAFSKNGYDNVSIPLSVIAVMQLFG
ncbi:phosphatidate cytidylyltransferase [Flavobacterium silvaticum]|uniref:Phosphatidate cytidylyltransferase n=1 Tax=Flavobacterium silvaticum TaxID=1852020 RepID=A0A972JH46_9FLAO|nr:phosphatidate cytidylyltransferase [Flavobacterium silvaticum]NMH27555.1 phosphatidate cytidylyltransferase [Flavobacterium silvaticum]